MDENTEVTATADAPVSDRFEVETNIEAPAEVKIEAKAEVADTQPDEEPLEEPAEKTINPRTLARKAAKERADARIAELEAKVAQYEQSKQSEQTPVPKRDTSKEPDINDYDDYMEYNRAVNRYDAAQLYKEESSKLEMQKLESAFDKRAETVRAQKPDFDEKVVSLVESQLLTPDINKAILSSEMSAEVSYHLAENGSDLMILRGLLQAAIPDAIKTIEQFIKNGDNQEKPRVTQAAPPIKPPSGMARTNRSISSYSQEEIENMPLSEYNKILLNNNH